MILLTWSRYFYSLRLKIGLDFANNELESATVNSEE